KLTLPRECNFEGLRWALEDACKSIRESADVRVAVITSRSDEFLKNPQSSEDLNLNGISEILTTIEIPIIAGIEKGAHGLGLEVTLACDIRVCSVSSTFSMPQVGLGHIPVNGGTQRLPRVVGQGRALELILTGRKFDSTEAVEMGLIQYVSEGSVSDDALELAVAISRYAPIAAKYLKEAINSGMDMTIKQGMGLEADLSVILQSTADRSEGIRSFLIKRDPNYNGE
ncbi:MAG: enoyl-CoA hydratase-related protein, partial [Chloroflexota bacterium]|nr:enoyl-CoA hydratase-related protein [Chloroflexota bacterium]